MYNSSPYSVRHLALHSSRAKTRGQCGEDVVQFFLRGDGRAMRRHPSRTTTALFFSLTLGNRDPVKPRFETICVRTYVH